MSKKINEYLSEMSNNNMDTLGTIISTQYRKFMKFYYLVSGFSEDIFKLEYEFKSEESLDVSLIFDTNKKAKKSHSLIIDQIDESYDFEMELLANKINLKILLHETN